MKKPTTYAHWCLTCDSGGEVTEPSEAARIALAHQRATLHENGEFRIPQHDEHPITSHPILILVKRQDVAVVVSSLD